MMITYFNYLPGVAAGAVDLLSVLKFPLQCLHRICLSSSNDRGAQHVFFDIPFVPFEVYKYDISPVDHSRKR